MAAEHRKARDEEFKRTHSEDALTPRKPRTSVWSWRSGLRKATKVGTFGMNESQQARQEFSGRDHRGLKQELPSQLTLEQLEAVREKNNAALSGRINCRSGPGRLSRRIRRRSIDCGSISRKSRTSTHWANSPRTRRSRRRRPHSAIQRRGRRVAAATAVTGRTQVRHGRGLASHLRIPQPGVGSPKSS